MDTPHQSDDALTSPGRGSSNTKRAKQDKLGPTSLEGNSKTAWTAAEDKVSVMPTGGLLELADLAPGQGSGVLLHVG